MVAFIKNLFKPRKVDLMELLIKGAVVVDVRSKEEYAAGHIHRSLHIPLEQIAARAEDLKQHPHVIVCCRSGNRSAMAERILREKGLSQVTNGGSWQHVNQYTR
jgi:rhodanese-related sulfurtransferase